MLKQGKHRFGKTLVMLTGLFHGALALAHGGHAPGGAGLLFHLLAQHGWLLPIAGAAVAAGLLPGRVTRR